MDKEMCEGRNCKQRGECALYSGGAKQTHGWMDTDSGWTCPEWERKVAPVVEDDDLEGLTF